MKLPDIVQWIKDKTTKSPAPAPAPAPAKSTTVAAPAPAPVAPAPAKAAAPAPVALPPAATTPPSPGPVVTPTPMTGPCAAPTSIPSLPPEIVTANDLGGPYCETKPKWATACLSLGAAVQITHLGAPYNAPGTVDIAWVQIFGVDAAGNSTLLGSYTGNDIYGELHTRYPWWGVDPKTYAVTDPILPWPSRQVANCIFTFQVSADPQHLFHWWTPKVVVPASAVRVWYRSCIRVTGGALVTVGGDWWRSVNDTVGQWGPADSTDPNTTTTDIGDSPWITAGGWQIVTVAP